MISTCSACAGIIVAIVSITGIGYKFISIITDLGQFHILLLLILLMFTCFVLGTGVPRHTRLHHRGDAGRPGPDEARHPHPVGAHVRPLLRHPFGDNPSRLPVRLRGGIHRGSQRHGRRAGGRSVWGSSPTSSPSSSSSSPPLLLTGEFSHVAQALVTSFIGVITLAGGMQGYLMARCFLWERVLLLAAGIALLYPEMYSDLAGLGVILFIGMLQYLRRGNALPQPDLNQA